MKLKKIFTHGATLGCVLGLAACANMSALQTAETLEPGKGEVSLGAGYINSKSVSDGLDTDINAPYMEFMYRYGLMDKLDGGVKISIVGTAAADAKYQFYQSGSFDAAVGAGLGYTSVEIGSGDSNSKVKIYDLMLPVYLSSKINESITAYASPKYMLRLLGGNGDGHLNLLAASLGVKIGQSSGVMVESTYAKALGEDFDSLQFNGAVFFAIE